MKTAILAALTAAAALLPSAAHAGWWTAGAWNTEDLDGSTWEVYADGINDFPGTDSDLGQCVAGSLAFAGRLHGAGYSYQVGGDADAWSLDFEEAGYDDWYADASDYAYISSHGSSDFVAFNSTAGDNGLTSSETFFGERDLDVIAYDACNVLDGNGRWNHFANSLNEGQHFAFGFDTVTLDTPSTADLYGYYLTQGYTHVAAWQTATQQALPTQYTFPNGGPTINLVAALVQWYSPSCNTWNDTMNVVACDPKANSWGAWATWGT